MNGFVDSKMPISTNITEAQRTMAVETHELDTVHLSARDHDHLYWNLGPKEVEECISLESVWNKSWNVVHVWWWYWKLGPWLRRENISRSFITMFSFSQRAKCFCTTLSSKPFPDVIITQRTVEIIKREHLFRKRFFCHSNLFFKDSNWQLTPVEARKILKQTLS